MKNYLAILSLVGLLVLSGCSSKRFANLNKIRDIRVPFLNNLKKDPYLVPPEISSLKSSLTEVSIYWRYNSTNRTAGFRIFRLSPKSKKYILIKTIADQYARNYVDKHLKEGTVYKYKISVYTKDKRVSRLSPEKSIATKAILQRPKLTATKNLINKIKLLWSLDINKEDLDYYQIVRSKDRIHWRNLATIKKTLQTEYIDDGLRAGDGYYYAIYGVTHDGVKTKASNIVLGFTKTAPKPPTDIIATTNLPRKIQLRWFDPNDGDNTRNIVGYNIYTSIYNNQFFIKHASTKKYNKFFIDRVDYDGKKIYYKVTAVDSDGLESPLPLKPAVGSTKENSPSPKITEYRLVDGRVIIKWEPMSRNIKSYIVKKRFYSKFFLPKTVNYKGITSNQFVDKEIELKKSYKYTVIGVDNDGILTKPSKQISIEIK